VGGGDSGHVNDWTPPERGELVAEKREILDVESSVSTARLGIVWTDQRGNKRYSGWQGWRDLIETARVERGNQKTAFLVHNWDENTQVKGKGYQYCYTLLL